MASFTPANPDFVATVRRNIAESPVCRWFGFTVAEVRPGAISLSLDGRPELGHQPGFFQGAVLAAMADYAGSYASYTLTPAGWNRLTLDVTIKFLASAQGERLIGRGRVLAAGRTLSTSSVELSVVRGASEHLCATALVSIRQTPPRD